MVILPSTNQKEITTFPHSAPSHLGRLCGDAAKWAGWAAAGVRVPSIHHGVPGRPQHAQANCYPL